MLKEEVARFLKNIPPFNFLADQELATVVDSVAMEFYPRGTRILVQDGPPSAFLGVVQKGGIKVSVAADGGEETVIDCRGEGEIFGLLSLVSGDRSRATVIAMDDTICYLIPRDIILPLIQANPAVSQFFLKSFFIGFIDKTHEEIRKKYGAMATGDRRLFTTRVGELVHGRPVTVTGAATIQEAAREMAARRISSVVVVDQQGRPMGMVTDRDLREKVVAQGLAVDRPVREIMSSELVGVEADEPCFEALLRMVRHRIHHILVMEEGRLAGLVTNHDFMLLQGASPTVLVKDLERARRLDELRDTALRARRAAATLLREGARALNVTGFLTELAEKLVNRVLDLLETELGPPPVGYSVFMIEAAGRRELTLDLILHLGIVYDADERAGEQERPVAYFSRLAERAEQALTACGFAGPEEGILPACRVKSVADWRNLFRSWGQGLRGIVPQAGFFDSRAIRGEARRVRALHDILLEQAASNQEFLFLIATRLVENRPPLGFFKKFVVEKNGAHQNQFNLYDKGLRPLVESVRLLAAARGVRAAGTAKRLDSLARRRALERPEDVRQAVEYLLALLLHHQLQQLEVEAAPDSFINPDRLSGLEKKTLKESFLLTTELYDGIEKSYISDIVA